MLTSAPRAPLAYHPDDTYAVVMHDGTPVAAGLKDLNAAQQAARHHAQLSGLRLGAYVIRVPERFRRVQNDKAKWPPSTYSVAALRA